MSSAVLVLEQILTSFKIRWPLWFAGAFTAVFFGWAFCLASSITTHEGVTASRWQHFLSGRPNEIGDTLAGFVGSLTLLWVVASVIQQSMELVAQRREFEKMVEAQDAQVRALSEQAAIFQDEKRRRDQDAAKRYVDELVSTLDATLSSGLLPESALGICRIDKDGMGRVELSIGFSSGRALPETPTDRLRAISFEIGERISAQAQEAPYRLRIAMVPNAREQLDHVISTIEKIEQKKGQVDSGTLEKLENIRFNKFRDAFMAVKCLIERAEQ